MKLNTKKFIRNIIICIVAFIVVSLILNYAPGFKRDKYAGITKLIVNDEDITENLKERVYASENNAVYLSLEDVKNIFDKNIFYDENLGLIITTSNTKIANIHLTDTKIIINGVEQELKKVAFKTENTIYIPVSELNLVYNIETKYLPSTNTVVIEKLNDGLIKAEVEEKATIKFKPRLISKNIGEVNIGDSVSCYYTTSKGWRLIRTQDGKLGYVKANILENEYIVRQDYDDTIKTAKIETNLSDGSSISLYDEQENANKIVIKTLFNFIENGSLNVNEVLNEEDYTVWATISNKGLEKYTNEMISNFEKRNELINLVLEYVTKYKLKGINIDFNNVTDNETFSRFIIELTPRLREVGVTTNVILNESIEEKKIIGIVDYLLTKKEQ